MGQSYRWLEFGDIKRETERRVVAAEDQTVNSVQTILKIQISRNKLTINAGYVNNAKKLLTP
jgi:hypothetical protein